MFDYLFNTSLNDHNIYVEHMGCFIFRYFSFLRYLLSFIFSRVPKRTSQSPPSPPTGATTTMGHLNI